LILAAEFASAIAETKGFGKTRQMLPRIRIDEAQRIDKTWV